MGKGGKSHEEVKNGEEENMAAWLVGLNTLKIQPFNLPPLGMIFMTTIYLCVLSGFFDFISFLDFTNYDCGFR